MKHIKLKLRDTFSGAVHYGTATVSHRTLNKVLSDVGKVVHTEKRNDITYHWQLEQVTDLNNNVITKQ